MVFRSAEGSIQPVQSVSDWKKRREAILAGMTQIMGPLPGPEKRCPLDVRIEEEVDCGDFVRRFLSYQAEPGGRVPAYLLIPKTCLSGTRRAPAVLALHQTHPQGQKVVVGLGNSPNDEYGVELVRRGYVVLAPAYPRLVNYQPDLKSLGYQSGTMKAIWDNIRGLDYLESLPFVRTNGFGAMGHSLGGHNSIFTAVFDERIRVVATSCGFDSFVDYMNGSIRGWASERYMPRLLDFKDRLGEVPFDFPELIGALAPRPCFVSAPIGDTNFGWRSVDQAAAAARTIYALFGETENLIVEHPECGHLFPPEVRKRVFELFDRVLLDKSDLKTNLSR
jgi:dienelactone hydrolase